MWPKREPQPPGPTGVELAVEVGAGAPPEVGLLGARGGDPAAQPLLGQLGLVGTEVPRARPALHHGAPPGERVHGDRDGVRPQQPAVVGRGAVDAR